MGAPPINSSVLQLGGAVRPQQSTGDSSGLHRGLGAHPWGPGVKCCRGPWPGWAHRVSVPVAPGAPAAARPPHPARRGGGLPTGGPGPPTTALR